MSIYLLSNSKHKGVVNLPQIEINFKKVDIDYKDYDALIFSSKNGVRAVDASIDKWRDIPAYSIGSATSKEITRVGGNLVYEAKSSYGDDFAKEIILHLQDKRVLFLRAKKIVSNIESILKEGGVKLDSIVVYETKCAKKIDIEFEEDSIFIFTSPSTVECFFKNYEWKSSFRAVCIGEVTNRALPKEVTSYVSTSQNIQALIEFAHNLKTF